MRTKPAWIVLLVATACSTATDSNTELQGYAPVVRALESAIEHEMRSKALPAMSISIVDDQETVWSKGFGVADPEKRTPATSRTMYRVGSVSKLFTDIGVMQLVERGELDLDAPVRKYLPDFDPAGPTSASISLRHLMSHRAGIIREPAVGNYFDDTEPSLAATVASINGSGLIYTVGTRTKYSNAGIAVVGRVLEKVSGTPFAKYLERAVLDVCGMPDCAFEKTPTVLRRLAKARMWTHDGRDFEAPTFELGMAPAGSLYASVDDLATFLKVLFRGGDRMIRAETLETMLTPQDGGRFGIGFSIGELDGHKSCGHGGAIYGFATQLSFLPESKLGVSVVTNVDCANAVTGRLATYALRLLLAHREKRPLPAFRTTQAVDARLARRVAGRYRGDTGTVTLSATDRGLELFDGRGIYRVGSLGDAFAVDDRHRFSTGMRCDGTKLTLGSRTFVREPETKPAPPPERWLGLIGEYGWDHNVLFVHERDGHLYALVEWFEFDELREISDDDFAFPASHGMYHGERLTFERDAAGIARTARIGDLVFRRRPTGLFEGTFKITPVEPIEKLRAKALAASPPRERRPKKPELVDLASIGAAFRFDIRYASTNNFMGAVFYEQPRAFLQKPAAEACRRAHDALAAHGYGLLIHDAYRPWHVTKMFFDATPSELKHFVADPSKGSRHNRGCAVDLTLYELESGRVIEMPSGFDEFSPRAYPDYRGGTSLQRWHRDLLRRVMEQHGFRVYEHEWWHFDYEDWRSYPILNVEFSSLERKRD